MLSYTATICVDSTAYWMAVVIERWSFGERLGICSLALAAKPLPLKCLSHLRPHVAPALARTIFFLVPRVGTKTKDLRVRPKADGGTLPGEPYRTTKCGDARRLLASKEYLIPPMWSCRRVRLFLLSGKETM